MKSEITDEDVYRAAFAKVEAENTRLRTQLKSVEADVAVMREACQKGLSAIDKLMGDSDLDSDESDEMKACQLLSKSLATNAGKSLLERLKEAERLLSLAYPGMHTCETSQWFADRDAFLNPKPRM